MKLLIVANTPSDNTRTLFEATKRGARDATDTAFEVVAKTALEADSSDVLSCDGIIIGTTENFGYMSGLIKDFFERIYYDCLEKTQALPYTFYVKAGQDGHGTLTGLQRITTGLKWKLVQEPLLLHGSYDEKFESQCEDLGAVMAAGLEAGVF